MKQSDMNTLNDILDIKINKGYEPHKAPCDFISYIELTNLTGMIYKNDFDIYCYPHIFICSLESDDIISIRLDRPKYYKPKKYKGKFTDIQLNEFIEYLKSDMDFDSGDAITYWEWINDQYESGGYKRREVFKRGPKEIIDYTKLNK